RASTTILSGNKCLQRQARATPTAQLLPLRDAAAVLATGLTATKANSSSVGRTAARTKKTRAAAATTAIRVAAAMRRSGRHESGKTSMGEATGGGRPATTMEHESSTATRDGNRRSGGRKAEVPGGRRKRGMRSSAIRSCRPNSRGCGKRSSRSCRHSSPALAMTMTRTVVVRAGAAGAARLGEGGVGRLMAMRRTGGPCKGAKEEGGSCTRKRRNR
ncbi:unnamed protein product, partial [Ectocarpus fasciculatus]